MLQCHLRSDGGGEVPSIMSVRSRHVLVDLRDRQRGRLPDRMAQRERDAGDREQSA